MDKVNIYDRLANISEHWSQQTIAEANGNLFKLAKGQGETKWHRHTDQDELFWVLEGELTIQLEDRSVTLGRHEMFVVPKGAWHCPVAENEASFMIVGLNITSNAEGGKPN